MLMWPLYRFKLLKNLLLSLQYLGFWVVHLFPFWAIFFGGGSWSRRSLAACFFFNFPFLRLFVTLMPVGWIHFFFVLDFPRPPPGWPAGHPWRASFEEKQPLIPPFQTPWFAVATIVHAASGYSTIICVATQSQTIAQLWLWQTTAILDSLIGRAGFRV